MTVAGVVGDLVVICAWCGGVKQADGTYLRHAPSAIAATRQAESLGVRISHGCCGECAARMRRELKGLLGVNAS